MGRCRGVNGVRAYAFLKAESHEPSTCSQLRLTLVLPFAYEAHVNHLMVAEDVLPQTLPNNRVAVKIRNFLTFRGIEVRTLIAGVDFL